MNRYVMLICYLFLCFGLATAMESDPPGQRAEERQRAAVVASFTFQLAHTREKGSVSEVSRAHLEGRSGPVPTATESISSDGNRVVFRHERTDYDMRAASYYISEFRVILSRDVFTHDGTVSQSYHHDAARGPRTGGGQIKPSSIDSGLSAPEWYPFLWCARGNAAINRFPVADHQSTGASRTIAGVSCREYRMPSPHGDHSLFIDAANPDRLMLLEMSDGGVVLHRTVIASYAVADGVEYPTAWIYSAFSKAGRLLTTDRITVDSASFAGDMDAPAFAFPVGMGFTDHRTGVDYKIREDGSWMTDAPGRKRADVEADLASTWWQRHRIWFFAVPALLSAIVLAWLTVMRGRRRGSLSASLTKGGSTS